MKLREKFWLLAAPAHDDDIYFGTAVDRRIGCWSRITPTEGASLLGISNIIMLPSGGVPVPFSDEALGYLESFCRMKSVLWGVTGSDGFRIGNEEDFIVKASEEYENISGAFANDLFVSEKSEGEIKDILQKVRKTLDGAGKKLKLWASVYADCAERFSDTELYKELDGIVVWSRNTDEIPDMENKFSLYEKLLPDKEKMLGIYMFDYVKREFVEPEKMEMALKLSEKLISEGRIKGTVIRSNCTMGLGYDVDYFLREWMDKNGDREI